MSLVSAIRRRLPQRRWVGIIFHLRRKIRRSYIALIQMCVKGPDRHLPDVGRELRGKTHWTWALVDGGFNLDTTLRNL